MSFSGRAAQPLIATSFVVGGIDTLRDPGPRIKQAEGVAPAIAGRVGLPTDTELLVRINAGVQVGAGVLLAFGKLRRLSALLLLGSLAATTWAGHPFWDADDPEEASRQRMQFAKNVGLAGGLLLALSDRKGKSLSRRTRRARRAAAASVAHAGAKSAVAAKTAEGGADHATRDLEQAAREFLEVARHVLAERPDLVRAGAGAVAQATRTAAGTVGEAADLARKLVPEASSAVSRHAVQVGHEARHAAAVTGRKARRATADTGRKARRATAEAQRATVKARQATAKSGSRLAERLPGH